MYGGLKNLCRYLLAGAGAIGILTAGGLSVAKAATLEELQAQLIELQKQVNEAKAAAAAAQAAAANAGGSDLDLKIKWKGAPQITSADGKKFSFKIRGRLMADFDHVDQDFNITGKPNVDAVEMRRARLGVEGVVFYDVAYKFEVDFADNEVSVKDAYVAYTGLKPSGWKIGEVRFGNQYVYNSMEELTSSRFITFMERPAYIEAFGMDRQIGAAALAGGEHWSFQTGIYGAPIGDVAGWYQDQNAFSVRGTWAPINREVNGVNQVVHLGASYRHRDEAEDNRSDLTDAPFRYRARAADLHLSDRLIGTPFVGQSDDLYNLEAAVVWGSFALQGEYANISVDAASVPGYVTPNAEYDGWYAEASWFITGESKNYEAKTGEFGRPKVKNPVLWGEHGGGWGAWQIAGRYNALNLSDTNGTLIGVGSDFTTAAACTICGNYETWVIGVNWWLNDYTRMMLNVSQTNIEGSNPTNGLNSGNANGNKSADITGVGLRAQVDW
jgi:phosphate-selective porin OprO and OprP